MALPAAYSLTLYRGDSFRVQFRLWADAAKTEAVDLTGATAAAEIRAAPQSLPLVALACAITDNVIEVSLTAGQSIDVPRAAYWDLQLTYASGEVQTIVAGGVSVREHITGSTVGLHEVAHA